MKLTKKEKMIQSVARFRSATRIDHKGSTLLHWGDSVYMWCGRGFKPTTIINNIKFSRFETMGEVIAWFKDRAETKENRKIANKVFKKRLKNEYADKIKPGTVLCWSGGYDQTNVEFYMVKEKTSKFQVVVYELGYTRDENDTVTPDLSSTNPKEKGGITAHGVKIGRNTFWIWDGEPMYATSPYNLR